MKVFMVNCMVYTINDVGKNVTTVRGFFIGILSGVVKRFGQGVRSDWGLENSLHWVLDVSFSEDANRTRKGHAPENYAILRHIALNILRKDTTSKKSIKLKRLRAGWDTDYLEQLLDVLQAA
jgi:predicted transposase YbfD/YdcC